MIPKLRAWDKQDERMSYGEVEYFDDSINYRFDHFCTGADEDVLNIYLEDTKND